MWYVQSCYVILCYATLCYIIFCSALLCYAMFCSAMLCYVMLCYVMLRHNIQQGNQSITRKHVMFSSTASLISSGHISFCSPPQPEYLRIWYVQSCYVILCSAMLRYALLCYVMFCYVRYAMDRSVTLLALPANYVQQTQLTHCAYARK